MHDGTLSIGIIGAGIMGERLLRAILDQSPPLVKVSGIWDPAPSAMERMAATFPHVPRLADAAAIIAASDCVYIASPPSSHLGHARAAIAAGKSVFCEKPLAVDVAEARAFVAKAGDRGAVNFPFASSPAVATLMDWIAQGAVGTASRVTVEVAFATWPRSWQADAAAWLDGRQQGGFTREVVSHFLFLSRRLLGPLHGLSANAAFPETGESERSIEARLMAGDIPIELKGSVGTTAKDDHNIWMLEGDRGAVRLCDWSVAERRRPDGTWERAPDALSQADARPIALRRQIEGVVRLTHGEAHHLATLAEALNVQEIVEAILASGVTAAG
ncbi:Gfo/Idh/MocA family protein [Bosea sp. (in: a-proteobacteria)]|uniref:Gfo/Idh/MocA family protein n=1 Tax=Bosea sp. (in: a-proteobacteria) TaxID=1871050 RepID=UPI0027337C4A|nr:Gfo/Idh/MocA family oxidoreductase [Bosea sp. (in: a-proteobacteria)]MDP3410089.1 Gfo/Idh/MocA family oxidoreductase [Bosea sp. (in: a-proteobacteria)]